MATPVQLPTTQQPEAPLESPEILMINALLEAPEGFRPEVYGVSKDMLAGWTKAWQFCVDHQQQTGTPPSRELVGRTYPDLELLSGVNPKWAAQRLRDVHHEREMRRSVRDSLNLLNEGDIEGARDKLAGIMKRPTRSRPQGLSVLDLSTVEEGASKIGYPVPWATLQRHTGGIGLGELWLVGARLGEGKSWMLPLYCAHLAEHGATVAVLTLEMPRKAYTRRLHAQMARNHPEVRKGLKSKDRDTRVKALKSMPRLPGKIDVFDPSDLEGNTRSVKLLAQDYQFVVVDHIGLLTNAAGKRAVEDWRVQAEISNTLKETTLESRVGIVAAAQINREGASAGYTPPKVHQLAGADDLGRDADAIVLMRRMGESTMLHDVPKNREGRATRFYTKFEPENADFSEISKDVALDRARRDGERLEST